MNYDYDNDGLTALVKKIGSINVIVTSISFCLGITFLSILLLNYLDFSGNKHLSSVGIVCALLFPAYSKLFYCGLAGFSLFDWLAKGFQYVVNMITYWLLFAAVLFPFSMLLDYL